MIFPEAVELMHPFVEDGHDTDRAVTQDAPVDEMAFVTTVEAVDAELARDRPPGYGSISNRFEPDEQSADIMFGLRLAPTVEGAAINVIDPRVRSSADAITHKACGLFRAITLSTSSTS